MKPYIIPMLAALIGCSPQLKVHTDFEWDYDQWTYRTCAWASKTTAGSSQSPLYHDELIDRTIKQAVDSQLAAHGYAISSDGPDLMLHYQVIVNEEATLPSGAFAYSNDPYWIDMPRQPFTYREGTLIIDLTDARSGHLVWRGWAVAPVDERYKSEKIKARIHTAVEQIFKNFPGNAKAITGQQRTATKIW
ncbi:DUF4136 domain-containing protein [Chryseolinea lacunae]|uniref:DUF4136 domain-containing protein n=1 Tax=Chryseolinea lacunae TaxID=2801331 RepID=A0ABS1KU74_9BACT|nr:DUF4136 domain-containing protein [Chryseolinea lacunae]MBL0743020.1 DUF4136 domain-containing protein [Chryseolinea lacunae]